MLNLQEAKKKTYTSGTTTLKIRDPLVFNSRLTSARKLVNEIKVLPEDVDLYEKPTEILDNYYREPLPGEDDFKHSRAHLRSIQPGPGLELVAPSGHIQSAVIQNPNNPLVISFPKSFLQMSQVGGSHQEVHNQPPVPTATIAISNLTEMPPQASPSKNQFSHQQNSQICVPTPTHGKASRPKSRVKDHGLDADGNATLGKRSVHSMPHSKFGADPATKPKYCCPRTGVFFSTLEEYDKIRKLKELDEIRALEREQELLRVFLLQRKKKFAALMCESYD